jgi:hypothetical protein
LWHPQGGAELGGPAQAIPVSASSIGISIDHTSVWPRAPPASGPRPVAVGRRRPDDDGAPPRPAGARIELTGTSCCPSPILPLLRRFAPPTAHRAPRSRSAATSRTAPSSTSPAHLFVSASPAARRPADSGSWPRAGRIALAAPRGGRARCRPALRMVSATKDGTCPDRTRHHTATSASATRRPVYSFP